MTTIFVCNANMFQSSRAFWLLYDIYFFASVCLTTYNADVLKSVTKYVVLFLNSVWFWKRLCFKVLETVE